MWGRMLTEVQWHVPCVAQALDGSLGALVMSSMRKKCMRDHLCNLCACELLTVLLPEYTVLQHIN